MTNAQSWLGLDVGEKRIGVARVSSGVKIAVPHTTLAVDGTEIERLHKIIDDYGVERIVVGYPRNQSGEATAQSQFSEAFARRLEPFGREVVFQDESLTSVMAEQYLKASKKPYQKGDIDAVAASILLQDYVERQS